MPLSFNNKIYGTKFKIHDLLLLDCRQKYESHHKNNQIQIKLNKLFKILKIAKHFRGN